MEHGQQHGLTLTQQDNVQRVQSPAISALCMAAETLIIAANYDFEMWLSAHDKWNKQATFSFVSHRRAIRSEQLSIANDLKKIEAKSLKQRKISPVILSPTQSLSMGLRFLQSTLLAQQVHQAILPRAKLASTANVQVLCLKGLIQVSWEKNTFTCIHILSPTMIFK